MGKIGQGIQAGVGILVLASGVGAFYVWNHDPALKQRLLEDVGAASKPAPQPPVNAPIGFNAARTAFVLPYHLGYLPAPELALAKSDPAYAAGLANLGDWRHSHPFWFYSPPYGGEPGSGWAVKYSAINTVELLDTVPPGDRAVTSSAPIRSSHLHLLPNLGTTTPIFGYEYVVPSILEIEAAPVMNDLLAPVCVPSPIAFLQNGHIVAPPQLPVMTAGPSTVFTVRGSGRTYDHGVASCAGFS